jgi:DNA-binding Lrp family transcriptional regulator
LVSAYILANVETGADRKVFRDIKKLPGVNKVSMTFGTYDLCIEVNFKTMEELDEFVFDKLRKIPKIRETVTVICSETIT